MHYYMLIYYTQLFWVFENHVTGRCQGLFPPILSSAEKSPGNEVAYPPRPPGSTATTLRGGDWNQILLPSCFVFRLGRGVCCFLHASEEVAKVPPLPVSGVDYLWLLFGFTFIPYCIQVLFQNTTVWVQLLVLVFSLAVWIFFPFLRRRSSFVVVVYLYSYFVYWRAFKDYIFGVKYSDYSFFRLMFAFGSVLWIAPALGALQQRLVYLFNRYMKKSNLFVFSSFM